MYWLIRHFPEFGYLDPAQRAQVLRRIPWWTYPIMIARSFAGGILGALILMVPFVSISPIRSSGLATLFAAASMSLFAGFSIAFYIMQMRSLRIALRKAIADGFRGEHPPFCFACGYDLRAATTAVCSECGRPTIET